MPLLGNVRSISELDDDHVFLCCENVMMPAWMKLTSNLQIKYAKKVTDAHAFVRANNKCARLSVDLNIWPDLCIFPCYITPSPLFH